MLHISNLSLQLGTFSLENIHLSIRKGEIFAVLGKTGAGKTVLLETIAGLYQDYKGSVTLRGRPMEGVPIRRRGIAFVYQDHGLFPHMTALDNICYGLRMHGETKKEARDKARIFMDLFEISHLEEEYPEKLSGGERQRTALARALVLEPDLLLLDEPFSALDPSTRRKMYGELEKIHQDFHCTILFVTHDFTEAQLLAHRIAILLNGRLRAVVDSDKLMDTVYEEDVELFLGKEKP